MDAPKVTDVNLEAMEENRLSTRQPSQLGIGNAKAWEYANTKKGYWHTSNSPILACTLTNAYFKDQGLLCFTEVYNKALNSMNCRMPNGTYSGVRGQ